LRGWDSGNKKGLDLKIRNTKRFLVAVFAGGGESRGGGYLLVEAIETHFVPKRWGWKKKQGDLGKLPVAVG